MWADNESDTTAVLSEEQEKRRRICLHRLLYVTTIPLICTQLNVNMNKCGIFMFIAHSILSFQNKSKNCNFCVHVNIRTDLMQH